MLFVALLCFFFLLQQNDDNTFKLQQHFKIKQGLGLYFFIYLKQFNKQIEREIDDK